METINRTLVCEKIALDLDLDIEIVKSIIKFKSKRIAEIIADDDDNRKILDPKMGRFMKFTKKFHMFRAKKEDDETKSVTNEEVIQA